MTNIIELKILCTDPLKKEMLIATLNAMGEEGFEEELLVYYPENNPEETGIELMLKKEGFLFSRQVIPS